MKINIGYLEYHLETSYFGQVLVLNVEYKLPAPVNGAFNRQLRRHRVRQGVGTMTERCTNNHILFGLLCLQIVNCLQLKTGG